VFLRTLLAASAAYLLTELFGYVFGLGEVRRHHVESAAYIFAAAGLALAFTGRGREARPPAERSVLPSWLAPAFIAVAGLVYGNTISLGLFSDDFVLARSALAGNWLPQGEFVRPLPLVVWKVLLGTTRTPAALHALSIGLHGINASLVSRLAAALGFPRASAIAVGLLFVAFPASVEAVAWPAAVHDLLVTCFALLFLLLASRRASAARVLVASAVLAAALLSKESAVAVPLLAVVLWFTPRELRQGALGPVLFAGVAVTLAYGVVRTILVSVPDHFAQAPSRYLVKEAIGRPVGTLGLPWSSALRDAWPLVPFSWAAACVAAATVWSWRLPDAFAFSTMLRCLAAVFVAVLPAYSILFVTPDLENARYLYLSTAFWSIALIGLVATPRGLGVAPLLLVSAAVIVGAAGVQIQLQPWREAARLRERVLQAAIDALHLSTCSTTSLAGAPDSVRGAYVFRNGLADAIVLRTGARPVPGRGECLMLWDGSAFQRAGSLAVPVQATFGR
jgi:hypothetical protein